MPLSRDDIARIKTLGYSGFVVTSDGWPRLRNIDGACFFLENRRCKIYDDRLEGSRLYPIIMNEDGNHIGIDDDCPYPDEFDINESDDSNLIDLGKRLEAEKSIK